MADNEEILRALSPWSNFIATSKTKTPIEAVLDKLPHRIIALFIGNQGGKCVTYHTLVDTPSGPVPVGELHRRGKAFDVYAWDGEKKVVAEASPPFIKDGLHECYRLEMANGQWVEMADHHRVLTSVGWLSAEFLYDTYLHNLLATTLEPSRSVHALNVSRLSRKQLDSQGDCLMNPRQYDVQLPLGEDNGKVSAPLQGDVRGRNYFLYEMGDLVDKYICNPLRFLFRLSNLDVIRRFLAQFVDVLSHSLCNNAVLFPRLCLVSGLQSEVVIFVPQLNCGAIQDQDLISLAYNNPSSILGNRILSFAPIGCQVVFDMTVPIYHNYFAGGLIHHNTYNVAKQYVKRLLGIHPIEYKNRLMKKVRCMSSSMVDSDDAEIQDNTQYLELKKLIPYEMIEKDVNSRSPIMMVKRPDGSKTAFEFRSSKQELQDLGKIQLSSVWHDEETPQRIREECKMRLLAENGDEYFSLTPVNYLSYTFSNVFQRANFIFRTSVVSEFTGLPQVEQRDTGYDVAVIQGATDDNPTLSPDSISEKFKDVENVDDLMIRRYAIFKQLSGRIHKSYNQQYCYIPFQRTFPNGIPDEWVHARGIDYHDSRIPWSIGWMSVSPQDEWFLWKEFHPSIDGSKAYSTFDIVKAVARKSENYEYIVNLIDPLANAKQPNTLTSVTDDLNRYFDDIRQREGLGRPAWWQGWDTKGTRGRDEVFKRFKNSVRCQKPFNNVVKDKGIRRNLPTLWICDTCPKFNESLLNWRYQEWQLASTQGMNDPKTLPQQKFSHDCMVLEGLAKDQRLLHAAHFMSHRMSQQAPVYRTATGRT